MVVLDVLGHSGCIKWCSWLSNDSRETLPVLSSCKPLKKHNVLSLKNVYSESGYIFPLYKRENEQITPYNKVVQLQEDHVYKYTLIEIS